MICAAGAASQVTCGPLPAFSLYQVEKAVPNFEVGKQLRRQLEHHLKHPGRPSYCLSWFGEGRCSLSGDSARAVNSLPSVSNGSVGTTREC